MKKRSSLSIALISLFICVGKIGWAQGGYVQFVDSLQSILSNTYNFAEVEDLVFSNLSDLRVRRLISADDEQYLFPRGYDLNKDSILNENDGFETIDQEKFTPWSTYLDMFPCHENQNVYLEVRGIDSSRQVLFINKMIKLRDPLITIKNCNYQLKIPLPPGETTINVNATDLIRGKVYDACVGLSYRDTIGLNTLNKFSIQPWPNYGQLRPKIDSTKRSVTLDCREDLKPTLMAWAWDNAGRASGCFSWIELIDSTGICNTSTSSLRFKDSLDNHLFKSFTALTPLFTALQIIKPEPEQNKARSYTIRRSISKNSIAQWIQLGYDRNGDGLLSHLDGYDWNQDGDITDEGEYFETKGSFLISPYLDTLPLVCSDFGDSLWVEVQANYARNVSRNESKWLLLPILSTYFGDIKPFYSSFVQLKPGKEPSDFDFNGIGIVRVSDFVKSPFYTCGLQNENTDKWGRNKLTQVSMARTRQIPDSTRKTLMHECCERRSPYVIVDLHLWNGLSIKPVAEFAVWIEIRDSLRACSYFGCLGEPPSFGTIVQGSVTTWQGQPLKNYQVVAEAYTSYNPYAYVNDQGAFSHYARYLQNIDHTYYIPEKNDDHSNGVTTFDLLQIQRHILGKQVFTTPYQFIAADINQSANISTLDLLQLRKVILNLETKFPNNTSWRFIDAAHVFHQPEEALTKYLPNRVLIKIPATSRKIDFIAVKIGDLNNSAILK